MEDQLKEIIEKLSVDSLAELLVHARELKEYEALEKEIGEEI